jgi:hypothetical protein
MIISLLEKNKFSAKKFFPIPNEKTCSMCYLKKSNELSLDDR